MKETQILSDNEGKFLVYSSWYKKLRIFSFEKNFIKEDFLKDQSYRKRVFLLRVDLNYSFPKNPSSFDPVPKPNLIITLGLKKKILEIIESKRKRTLTYKLDSKIESICNFKNNFFFYINRKIYILDQFSGEFFKKIKWEENFQKTVSVSLDLSKDGKFLIIQDGSIFLLNSKKGNILKKIIRPSTKIFFLNLWKRNRLFYTVDDGKVQVAILDQKKCFQIISFGLLTPKPIPIEIKPLKKGRCFILITFFRKKFYFFLFDFGKKIQTRFPFTLYINENKIFFCFLRSKKNLLIVFPRGKNFAPLKIILKENCFKIPMKKKDKRDHNGNIALIGNKKIVHTPLFDFFDSNKKKNQGFRLENGVDEIFFKFGIWKNLIKQKMLLNPFWLIKNVTRFKASRGLSEELEFFKKRNILKTIYNLSYEWVEPFLNFILKDTLKKRNFETNFLLWGKEIFFHHFFSLLENKIIRKTIEKNKDINFFREENFFELYISLALLTIQGEKDIQSG